MPVHQSLRKKKRRKAPMQWTISVNELPSELLVNIFHLVKFACLQAFLDWDWDEPMDLTWVRVSQVCHKWRELAISSPTLWSDIELTRPEVAIEMLDRSQSAPLHLHTRQLSSSSFKARKPVWLVAEPHLSRVRELDLPGIVPKELEFLTKNIDSPLPLLETLRIHGTSESLYIHLFQFFQREMPSLRTIDMQSCFIPRPLRNLPRLVSLTLYASPDGPCLWTVLEALESLEAMPLLEDAELVNIVSPFEPGDTSSLELAQQKKVDLANLMTFSIYDVHLDTSFVLSALRYRPTAHTNLQCSWASVITEAKLRCILDICSRTRTIEDSMSLTIHLHDDDVSIFVKDEDDNGVLTLSLNNVDSPLGTEQILKRLCKALPSSIDMLTMRSKGCPSDWRDLLGIFPALESVTLQTSPSAYPTFIDGLDGVVPYLSTLIIEGRSIEADQTFIPLLVDFLRKRKSSESPIAYVSLDERWKRKKATLRQLGELTNVLLTNADSSSLMSW